MLIVARIYGSGPPLEDLWQMIPWVVLKKNGTEERSMVVAEVKNNLIGN